MRREIRKRRRQRRGKKKKKIYHREDIYNIQTEGGPLKDQYLTGNREDTEEEGEQTGADDTPMSGATSTLEDGEEKEIEQETREFSRKTGPSLAKIKVRTDEDR